MDYYMKYLKYKSKYTAIKKQHGGLHMTFFILIYNNNEYKFLFDVSQMDLDNCRAIYVYENITFDLKSFDIQTFVGNNKEFAIVNNDNTATYNNQKINFDKLKEEMIKEQKIFYKNKSHYGNIFDLLYSESGENINGIYNVKKDDFDPLSGEVTPKETPGPPKPPPPAPPPPPPGHGKLPAEKLVMELCEDVNKFTIISGSKYVYDFLYDFIISDFLNNYDINKLTEMFIYMIKKYDENNNNINRFISMIILCMTNQIKINKKLIYVVDDTNISHTNMNEITSIVDNIMKFKRINEEINNNILTNGKINSKYTNTISCALLIIIKKLCSNDNIDELKIFFDDIVLFYLNSLKIINKNLFKKKKFLNMIKQILIKKGIVINSTKKIDELFAEISKIELEAKSKPKPKPKPKPAIEKKILSDDDKANSLITLYTNIHMNTSFENNDMFLYFLYIISLTSSKAFAEFKYDKINISHVLKISIIHENNIKKMFGENSGITEGNLSENLTKIKNNDVIMVMHNDKPLVLRNILIGSVDSLILEFQEVVLSIGNAMIKSMVIKKNKNIFVDLLTILKYLKFENEHDKILDAFGSDIDVDDENIKKRIEDIIFCLNTLDRDPNIDIEKYNNHELIMYDVVLLHIYVSIFFYSKENIDYTI